MVIFNGSPRTIAAETITDNHMWVVFRNSNGYVYVYFQSNKIHSKPDNTFSSVALTENHMMLAIATYRNVYIYEYNGT